MNGASEDEKAPVTYPRLPAEGIATPYLRCIRRLLQVQSEQRPDAVAIIAPGRGALTYTRLWEQVNEVVTALNERGIGRGDRVALVLPNGPEMAVASVAVAAGATSAPLNPAYTAAEFDFYLQDLNARALIVPSGFDSPAVAVAQARGIPILGLSPVVRAPAGVFTLTGDLQPREIRLGYAEPDDLALVLHTSGTTSRPKIVPLTHQNLCASAHRIRCALELTESDRCLNVMPLFHIHGLVGALLSSLAAGARIVCTPGFDAPRFFEWMQEFQPTWYTAVPTMHQAILARAAANSEAIARCPLRFIRSCSSPLPSSVMAELEHGFRAPVLEAYGMTEAAHQIASNPLPPRHRKPGSVGVAAGTEVAILDETGQRLAPGVVGEIAIRGANVMSSYERSPAANRSAYVNGWFRTGDQGYEDEEGYLFITGRLKEIINRGGEKISPREVDETLLDHPAIGQAVTFAVPHPTLGESVAAAVVLRTNASATPREIREFAAVRLASFKVPSRVLIVEEIPKGPTGKPQRIGLAEKLNVAAAGPGQNAADRSMTQPRTPLETVLAALWAQVLGLEQVGIDDNFLQLGGESVLATQLMSRVWDALQVELPLPGLFDETATIAEMATQIEEIRQEEPGRSALPVRTAPRPLALGKAGAQSAGPVGYPRSGSWACGTCPLPLSFAQERLWFLHQMEPENVDYNRPAALRLTGPLHREALEQSLSEILRRHEVLRTTFPSVQGRPIQVVAPAAPMSVPVVDLQGLPASEREAQALRLAREEARRPFDLAAGPVLRTTLARLDHEEHLLLMTLHHIAFDGWSMPVLVRELGALYEAFVSGKPSPLSELPVQYPDFAIWQRQWLQGEMLQTQLSYWKQQLAGAPTVLELPTDRSRSPVGTADGARRLFLFPHSLSERLKTLARQERATLFMTLLAAFQVLLYRCTGQEDLCVGIPMAGRSRREIEGLIGCFVNTLVMRADLRGDPRFRELLRRTREVALEAYVHQHLPFEKLVEELRPERDLNHAPWVQVMFQLRNVPHSTPALSNLKIRDFMVDTGMTPFALSVEVTETTGGLSCLFQYRTDLFDAATIDRMAGHFRTLLEGIGADPDQQISRLPLLTAAERHQLLVEWNQTEADYPRDRGVHQLFEAQVERTPDAVAVVFEDAHLTYRELDTRANELAHHLQKRGAGPDLAVAICVERSLEMVVGLLGILKAGAAYLPLDPTYPKERLAFMLEDARVRVLLTQQSLAFLLPDSAAHVLCLDAAMDTAAACPEDATHEAALHHLAYVSYTSGSTGKPKGVAMGHRALVNLVTWQMQHSPVAATARTLQFASLSFDVSFQEIFATLCSGGSLVMITRHEQRDSLALLRVVQARAVERLFLPFVALQQMSEAAAGCDAVPTNLKEVITAGEQLQVTPSIARLFNRIEGSLLENQYGPSETHVATAFRLSGLSSDWSLLPPIGRPIANTQIYVLDLHLQPVPIGVPGELYIGGVGLAEGYLNQPELTAERFIPHPFSDRPGARLYRTGDQARYLPDGNLEFLGRLDHQVKLRGFRIELGEIEAALCQHPGVRTAVVLAHESSPGNKRLVAYLVPRDPAAPSDSELRGFLGTKLPEYMLPAAFVRLPAFPLTPTGKVDRHALPAPELLRPELDTAFVVPCGPVEERLAAIWAAVLGLERVGVHDDFFALGGHSLLATQVIARIQSTLQVELPLRRLFEAPTVAGLATAVTQRLGRRSEQQTAHLLAMVEQLAEEEFPSRLPGQEG